MDFLLKILPNVASHPERFFNGFVETLIMTLWSGGISFVIVLIREQFKDRLFQGLFWIKAFFSSAALRQGAVAAA